MFGGVLYYDPATAMSTIPSLTSIAVVFLLPYESGAIVVRGRKEMIRRLFR